MNTAIVGLVNNINWGVFNASAISLTDIPHTSGLDDHPGFAVGDHHINARVKLVVVDDILAIICDLYTGVDYYFCIDINSELHLEDICCKAIKVIFDGKVPLFSFSKSNFDIVIEFPESDVYICVFPISRNIAKMHDIIDLWTNACGPLPFIIPMDIYVKVDGNYGRASVHINSELVCSIQKHSTGQMSFGEWDNTQDPRVIVIRSLLYELTVDILV